MLNAYLPATFPVALLLFAAAALLSCALTPAARAFAVFIGAMDVPRDARRMHREPTPLLGGLAIYCSFVLCALLFCSPSPFLRALLLGGSLIVVTGVFDDLYDLSPLLKLIAQAAAALLVMGEGVMISDIYLFGSRLSFGPFLSFLLTLLWIVGLTNATNLIDGLDGLASGVCVIASLSLAVITLMDSGGNLAVCALLLILAGAELGFIPHNFRRKKIFMGDTGALFLGFMLACLSVQGVFKTQAVLSFVAPVAIFSLPIFDTSFAFIRRILTGSSPFKADRKHLHHRLVDMGFTPHQAVFILWGISAFLSLLTILLYMFQADPLLSLLVIFLFFLLLYLSVGYRASKVKSPASKNSRALLRSVAAKQLLLLDMDGTLYIDNQPFKATAPFLAYLRKTGRRYYFLTNNSSKSAEDYVKKLRDMGIPASTEDFITSVQATVEYLKGKYSPADPLYVIGTESLKQELRREGFLLAEEPSEEVRCLLAAFDTELTFRKLEDACILLQREEVEFCATNPDWVCPTAFGSVPDCGSLCEMLLHATGRRPLVIGKPGRAMVDMALRRSGCTPEQALIVGDRLYTDIACGAEAGIDSAFVLSGEGTRKDLSESPVRPTFVFEHIGALAKAFLEGDGRI